MFVLGVKKDGKNRILIVVKVVNDSEAARLSTPFRAKPYFADAARSLNFVSRFWVERQEKHHLLIFIRGEELFRPAGKGSRLHHGENRFVHKPIVRQCRTRVKAQSDYALYSPAYFGILRKPPYMAGWPSLVEGTGFTRQRT